jgi:hypothetical protein
MQHAKRFAVAALLVVPVLLLGVWLAGAVLTEDARTAEMLTGAWFVLLGAAVVAAGVLARRWLVPLVATWAVAVAAVGGFLFLTSSVDQVVQEDVVTAAAPGAAPAPSARAPSPGDPAPSVTTGSAPAASAAPVAVELKAGRFRSGAHETTGTAQLVRRADGSLVVVLRDLDTDPGPDLRVYLAGRGERVEDGKDLGRLKGNKGTSQYAVPAGTKVSDIGSVAIWCRAFSVSFGAAELAA